MIHREKRIKTCTKSGPRLRGSKRKKRYGWRARAGIERVTVANVYVHGPDARRQVVSVETSTPKARAFVERILASPVFAGSDFSMTSRELRAVVDDGDSR